MSGVIKEIFEREAESMSGDDDFFSVARTTPLVAKARQSAAISRGETTQAFTFDSESGHSLIDSIQGIFYRMSAAPASSLGIDASIPI